MSQNKNIFDYLRSTNKIINTILLLFCLNANCFGQAIISKLQIDSNIISNHGFIVLEVDSNKHYENMGGWAYKNHKVNDLTIFNIGSCSKLYTAACIFKLQEKGLVNINDPVNKYVSIPGINLSDSVKIINLLNHTSGLNDGTNDMANKEKLLFYNNGLFNSTFIVSYNTLFGIIKWDSTKVNTPVYSSNGYFILGLIIQKVTQLPLNIAMEKIVFNPLALTNTYAYYPSYIENRAHPFLGVNDADSIMDKNNANVLGLGSGDIYTNIHDFYHFIDATLINNRFFNDKTFKLFKSKNVSVWGQEGEDGYYGPGWFSYTSDKGNIIYYHTGRNVGFCAGWFYCPKLKISIFIMENTFNANSIVNECEQMVEQIF